MLEVPKARLGGSTGFFSLKLVGRLPDEAQIAVSKKNLPLMPSGKFIYMLVLQSAFSPSHGAPDLIL